MPGRLLLVATPIGNLDDLSPRAIAAFRDADLVACEDTRHTGLLLHRLNLKKPLVSLHEHNERARAAAAPGAARGGRDDRRRLRRRHAAALRSGLRAHPRRDRGGSSGSKPIPGASAPLAALVVSGLPPYPFTFAGFAPPKSGKRRTFYRAPRRPRPHLRRLRVAAPAAREPRRRDRGARAIAPPRSPASSPRRTRRCCAARCRSSARRSASATGSSASSCS